MGKKRENMTDVEIVASELMSLFNRRGDGEKLSARRQTERIANFQEILLGAVRRSTLCSIGGRLHRYESGLYVPFGADRKDVMGAVVLMIAERLGMSAVDKMRVEGIGRVLYRDAMLKTVEVNGGCAAMENGVLDFTDGKLHKFSKNYVQIHKIGFGYDPDAQCRRWRKFLDEVLDESGQRVLQEFMGALFLDRRRVKIEKMMILHGAGRNGKSVVQSVICGILGEGNVSAFSLGDLTGTSHMRRNIATINGKRLNYCSEIHITEFGVEASAFKNLVSGERMEGCWVGGNPFPVTNVPLLMANANKIPEMKDISHGFAERLIILPFERIIEEKNQDKELSDKLRKEYPGILNWILEGRRRFVNNDYVFSMSKSMKDLIEELRSEGNTVLRFMKDRGYLRHMSDAEIAPVKILASEMYEDYLDWCHDRRRHIEKPESQKSFGLVLNGTGFIKARTNNGIVYSVYVLNNK